MVRVCLAGAIFGWAGLAAAQPADPYPPADPAPYPPDPYPGPAEPAPPIGEPAPPPDAPPPPGPYAQPPPPPYAQPPAPEQPGFHRGGWFIGFSLGAGSLTLEDNGNSSDGYGGGLFEVHFGGMVTPQLGLLVQLAGGAHPVDNTNNIGLTQGGFALGVQFWPMEQLWLRGTVGGGSLDTIQDGETLSSLDGRILSAAIGYEVWQGQRFAVDLSLAASLGRFDPDATDVGTTTTGLLVGFNWY